MTAWIVVGFFVSATILFAQLSSLNLTQFTTQASAGSVILIIESSLNVFNVTILSPLNTTYNFNVGSSYVLDLNVSATTNVSQWRFKHEDLFHSSVVNESAMFTPNTTFVAARRSNRLTVTANTSTNAVANASVIFSVSVPNTVPSIINLSASEFLACEDSTFSRYFNVSDPDEDDLTMAISPSDPFFVEPSVAFAQTLVSVRMFSGTLQKSAVGNHSEQLVATDNLGGIDTKYVNITVLEVNHAPGMGNISSVYTVYVNGTSSTLVLQPTPADEEDGEVPGGGNFSMDFRFNSGTPFFTMNASGYANLSGAAGSVGTYSLGLCMTDRGLPSIHPNASFCNETGVNKTGCGNFTITITNENRAPTIDSFAPINLVFNVSGTETTAFFVETSDLDGTIPSIYWYVDGALAQQSSGNPNSAFSYSAGCGATGNRTVRIDATDGLANASMQWNLTLTTSVCPAVAGGGTSGGGGGGGGGTPSATCTPKFGCGDWNTCQNTEQSLQKGVLTGADYLLVKNRCTRSTLTGERCGFQLRSCTDVNVCNATAVDAPEALSECYYVPNPGCSDKIKNCHDGLCEFLVDCGGPCGACATCSDGIQNQGEKGVDCGSPCPSQCP